MKRILALMMLLGGLQMPAYALDANVPVIKVQANNTDYRVSVLEEQVRQLNGRMEELNFQLLEMQELIRRMQEDNDFRFQQLEEKQGSIGSSSSETANVDSDGFIRLEKPEPSDQEVASTRSGGENDSGAPKKTIDGVELYDGEPGLDTNIGKTLGTIQFDENGNIIDSTLGKPLDLTAGLQGGSDNPASLLPANADDLFNVGYDHVQFGRYEDAERALLAFSERHSAHPRLPEARFWLGESYLGRGDYRKAAEVYLDAHKNWPNGKFGPQSLLKLGVSVAGMNQRELACATFAEVLQKYPDASSAIRESVSYEQRAAKCAIN